MEIKIRREEKTDYRDVENLTREAFWNLFVPGCNEHYLAHIMRRHDDFLPELDLVAVVNDKLVGSIMYAKSWLQNDLGNKIETVTFGPLSVLPEYQRKGIGSVLIQKSKEILIELGYKVIIIFGSPNNYCKHGFKNGKDLNVSMPDGSHPMCLLVLELEEGILKGNNWKYLSSDVYNFAPDDAEKFDKLFPPKEKGYRYTQDIFSIECRVVIKQNNHGNHRKI